MSEKKTIGVILSGCGFLDGAEIHESVLALLALSEAGVNVKVYAPNMDLDEVNHVSGEGTGQKRNVLIESSRISRGQIEDLANANATDVDGWVLPGGYGAAKNLSDFAFKGGDATANKEVSRVIGDALKAQLPIGACCIAPALLATVANESGLNLKLTIGSDEGTAAALGQKGATHINCPVDAIAEDGDHRVVSAPAYMLDASIAEVNQGIKKMVNKVVSWL